MWRITDCLFVIFLVIIFYNGGSGYTYIATERPYVVRYNRSILSLCNMSSLRYGRQDPLYYVNLEINALRTLDNSVLMHFAFYEFLSNEYRPSFIHMRFTWCQLIENDTFFGPTMRQGVFKKPCPYPPGHYNLQNMTIPVKSIPPGFPFRKGRIYLNVTLTDGSMVAGIHIDMEVRETNRKFKKTLNAH